MSRSPLPIALFAIPVAAAVIALSEPIAEPMQLSVMEIRAVKPLPAAISKCEAHATNKSLGIDCGHEDSGGVPAFTMTRLSRGVSLDAFEAAMVDVVNPLCVDGLVYLRVVDVVSPSRIRSYGMACDHGQIITVTGVTEIYME